MMRDTRPTAGRIAYVNGRYLRHGNAMVHVEDRGLQLGDSVYEICAVSGGRLIDEAAHLDRLERSLREIEIEMPMSRAALRLVIGEVARRNRLDEGLLYLQVTRGAARRDHPIPVVSYPSLILIAYRVDRTARDRRTRDGIAVAIRPDQRWGRCDIKSTQLLANLLAKTAARRAGAYEAWLVDDEGFVTEGASTTAWIVDADGRLTTRNLSDAILPGVTRRMILEAANEAQVPVTEAKFTPIEAGRAREAFVSSATGPVVPVVRIDGKPVGDGKPGPLTRRISALYARKSGINTGDDSGI